MIQIKFFSTDKLRPLFFQVETCEDKKVLPVTRISGHVNVTANSVTALKVHTSISYRVTADGFIKYNIIIIALCLVDYVGIILELSCINEDIIWCRNCLLFASNASGPWFDLRLRLIIEQLYRYIVDKKFV